MTGSPLCKPERNVSSFTANPKKAQDRFDAFTDSINATLESVLSHSSSSESPILEAVQAVGLRSFSSADVAHIKGRRLILVSDLVQNTHQVSFTKGVVPYESFRLGRTLDALRAPLGGVRVDILFLSRPNIGSAASLIDWWQRYFTDSGASIASVQRIVG